MTWPSAARALIELTMRQHRSRPLRAIVVASGVAVATVVVSGILGGGLIAGDLSQREDLAGLPDTARSFRVTMVGTAPDAGLTAPDRSARQALSQLSSTKPSRAIVFRETNLAGRGAILAGVDEIARWVTLTAGRLPRACTPQRCEVVQVAGAPATPAVIPGARFVLVGSGHLQSATPLGRDRLTGNSPLLVAGDTAGLSALPGVSFVYRSTIWTSPVDPDALHTWNVPALLDNTARAAGVVEAITESDLQLTGPTREILAARAAGRTAAQRLALLGAAGVALVLAFAALAASMLRGDHDDDRSRLVRRGATHPQLVVFAVADRAWISLVGTVIGAVAGVAVVTAIARATDRPVSAVLRHSLLSGQGVALIAGLWLLGTVVLMLSGAGPQDGVRVGRARLADIVAIGAIGMAALAATRGSTSATDLTSGSFDPFLVALPILISIAAGAIALRMTGPIVRWCQRRFARRRSLAIRLALLAQARRPRRVAMTAAFLVVATGLAIFATGYAATLARGQQDQAAFVVPLDATIQAGADLVGPFDVASPPAYRALGGEAAPIVRSPISITGVQSQPVNATVLGIPAPLLGHLPGWRDDASTSSRAQLASALGATSWQPLAGIAIPTDATALTLGTERVGAPMDMLLVVRRGAGSAQQISLGAVPAGAGSVHAGVPGDLRGAAILAVRLGLSAGQQISTGHAEAEGRGGDTLAGTLTLGALQAATPGGPVTLAGFDAWVGRGAITSRTAPTGVRLAYRLAAGRDAVVRAPHPSDTTPLPVIASADIAERAGIGAELTLDAGGSRKVRGRIVASARRFPTIGTESFVIADQTQLAAALDAADPGAGTAREVWISRRPGHDAADLARQLATPPFASLSVRSHAAELGARRHDPRARGVLWTLWGITAAALLLGIVALGLGTATDIRDERAELADLDAQGLALGILRSHLRIRGIVPLLLGTLGGVALGIGLVALVVRLVLVTAGSETPVPPLLRATDWPRVTGLLGAFVVVSAVAVAVVAGRASRAIQAPGASR